MTQLTRIMDDVIRYSESKSRDRQQAHVYDLLLEIRHKIRGLEDAYAGILQENEKLRGSIHAEKS